MSRWLDPASCCNSENQPPESFEMAYQIRVAIDKMRFAIKSSEQYSCDRRVMLETRMQLLDALQRLETAERRFSQASQKGATSERAQ